MRVIALPERSDRDHLSFDITLKSPSVVTIVRVGFSGFPVGFAVLFACHLVRFAG
jgi:hypothetical protein